MFKRLSPEIKDIYTEIQTSFFFPFNSPRSRLVRYDKQINEKCRIIGERKIATSGSKNNNAIIEKHVRTPISTSDFEREI